MRTNINTMNIFVRAVETNSFTGAARSLFTNPAVVSRAIKTLEAELGVLLFARSTRALRLTVEGRRFHRDCLEILKKFEEATQQFHTEQTAPRGRVTIGMGPGLPRRMMLRAVPEFQQQHPTIEITLVSVDDQIEIGDKGIDVLIRPRSLRRRGGQHPERQGLIVRKLFQSKFVTSASPEYLSRAGTPSVPADLCRHACIASLTLEGDIQNEWQFVRLRTRQNISFIPKLVAQGGDALREACLSGCGIARLNAGLVEEELGTQKLVPVLSEWASIGCPPMVAIYRKTHPMPPQINVFVRYITEIFRSHELE